MVKIIADECCDAALVETLRAQSYDVFYVLKSLPGADDENVLAISARENRILITEDKDFCELIFRLRRPVYAVILLRFDPAKKQEKYRAVSQFLKEHGVKMTGKFAVIVEDRVRMRSLSISG